MANYGVFDTEVLDKSFQVYWTFVEDEGLYIDKLYCEGKSIDPMSMSSLELEMIVDKSMDEYWATRDGDV